MSGVAPGISLARADLRFLLPEPVASAEIHIDGAWGPALQAVGIDVRQGDRGLGGCDLAVTGPRDIRKVIEAGPPSVLVHGADARRPLARAGYNARALLAIPDLDSPAAFLPLGRTGVGAYMLNSWLVPDKRWKRTRNRLAASALRAGAGPARRNVITLGSRSGRTSSLVGAAAHLGVPGDVDVALLPGQGDPLTRGILMIFRRGAAKPEWVLKFARVPGYQEQFDRDERGLAVAKAAGAVADAHVPKHFGRFCVDGVHASLESAARGGPLVAYLHSSASRRAKLATLDRIVTWLITLAVATASRERHGAARPVLAGWTGGAVPVGLADRLDGVPAVASHNDLGTWNMVVDHDHFTALDWEAARLHGLPLWDLWYLLFDALAQIDRVPAGTERVEHMVGLFTGRLSTSSQLFSWTRKMVRALALPEGSVGPLATLCWLHHAASAPRRRSAIELQGLEGSGAPSQLMEQVAARWLADPTLGPGWDAWMDAPAIT